MSWEKLVEREGDFLKNYLLYENYVECFPKVFEKNHSDFLTIRKQNIFTHYINTEAAEEMKTYLKEKHSKNQNFFHEIIERGKMQFSSLISFSEILENISKGSKNNLLLKELFRTYCVLYKAPYPYFNITVFMDDLIDKKEIPEIMAEWRLFARDHFNKTHSLAECLFKAIEENTSIPVESLKFLTPNEIVCLLEGKKIDIAGKVKKRQHCFFMHRNGESQVHENMRLEVLEEDLSELKGKGTLPACVEGIVRLIRKKEDLENINEGEIIVCRMTTPDLIHPQLKKAIAIVTDEGGITCHAAVVSREFQIPALLGTKSATKYLKDGDKVIVDTTNGFVRKV